MEVKINMKSISNSPHKQVMEYYSWFVNRFVTLAALETNHIFGYTKYDALIEVHSTFDPVYTLHHLSSEYDNPEYGWLWNTWEATDRLQQAISDLESFYLNHATSLNQIDNDSMLIFLRTRLYEEEDTYQYDLLECRCDDYTDTDN